MFFFLITILLYSLSFLNLIREFTTLISFIKRLFLSIFIISISITIVVIVIKVFFRFVFSSGGLFLFCGENFKSIRIIFYLIAIVIFFRVSFSKLLFRLSFLSFLFIMMMFFTFFVFFFVDSRFRVDISRFEMRVSYFFKEKLKNVKFYF